MKVSVLVGVTIFTFHNFKGKYDLKVLFWRLYHYSESNNNQHVLNTARVPETIILWIILFLTAALSGEYGCLMKATEVCGSRSHRT